MSDVSLSFFAVGIITGIFVRIFFSKVFLFFPVPSC